MLMHAVLDLVPEPDPHLEHRIGVSLARLDYLETITGGL